MTSTNPRGALNEWAQRHRLQLTFATAFNQGKGCFESSVTVPAIEQPEGGGPPVPGASFRGSGSRKKAAEAAAAEAALAHLAAFDLERPQKVTVADSATAAEALQAACSDKVGARIMAERPVGGGQLYSWRTGTSLVGRDAQICNCYRCCRRAMGYGLLLVSISGATLTMFRMAQLQSYVSLSRTVGPWAVLPSRVLATPSSTPSPLPQQPPTHRNSLP